MLSTSGVGEFANLPASPKSSGKALTIQSRGPPCEHCIQIIVRRVGPLSQALGLFSMSFEIIFITEGEDAQPAAEIQYRGQRLCILRYTIIDSHEIHFVQDLYVGCNIEMTFPLHEFITNINVAAADLRLWVENLALSQPET